MGRRQLLFVGALLLVGGLALAVGLMSRDAGAFPPDEGGWAGGGCTVCHGGSAEKVAPPAHTVAAHAGLYPSNCAACHSAVPAIDITKCGGCHGGAVVIAAQPGHSDSGCVGCHPAPTTTTEPTTTTTEPTTTTTEPTTTTTEPTTTTTEPTTTTTEPTTTTTEPTTTTTAPTTTTTQPTTTTTKPGVGNPDYSPGGALGRAHLGMYNTFGAGCTSCHNGEVADAAPDLSKAKKADMASGPCVRCHDGDKAPLLFISLMEGYDRCGSCHPGVKPMKK